tara:strand:+ start:305 stop:703 length:399 start_codon:yes stop_codon:yes gene_type:complete
MIIRLFLLSLYNWGVANSETKLQQEIRLALGTIPSLRLFRNQVGQLPDPRTGRYVQFGLAKGSSDLVGFKTVKITPEMIGQEVAQFVSIEIKTERGKLTEVQQNWLQKVHDSGGIVGVARSIQDALKIVKVS